MYLCHARYTVPTIESHGGLGRFYLAFVYTVVATWVLYTGPKYSRFETDRTQNEHAQNKTASNFSRVYAISPVRGDFILFCDRSDINTTHEPWTSIFTVYGLDVFNDEHHSVRCDGTASKPVSN